MTDGGGEANRLIDVELDESIGRSTPDVEHERAVAIFDLIEENKPTWRDLYPEIL